MGLVTGLGLIESRLFKPLTPNAVPTGEALRSETSNHHKREGTKGWT